MAKLLGVDFAPLNIPVERRLQTIGVLFYIFMFISLPFIVIGLMIWLAFYTNYWWLVALYGVWYMYDCDTPSHGGRPNHTFNNAFIWRWLRDYFPIKLEKTCDLSPKKNYIIGAHPHGLLVIGGFCNFSTNSIGFNKLFPGIQCHMLTLVGNFWFPIRREIMLLLGACDVSKQSIEYLLSQPTPGHAVVIVLGGASEALDAHPGKVELVMSRRKGFVKLAVKKGADIVPSFSFGENELFKQAHNPPGSFLRKIQELLRNFFGFSMPIFHGRGIFNYSFGLMPFRQQITTIVGKPIEIVQKDNPSEEDVDEYHNAYIGQLCQLFEDNKLRVPNEPNR